MGEIVGSKGFRCGGTRESEVEVDKGVYGGEDEDPLQKESYFSNRGIISHGRFLAPGSVVYLL